jgi:hypothetical protein
MEQIVPTQTDNVSPPHRHLQVFARPPLANGVILSDRQLDFIGVWDERIPKENKEWLGFTKFKEGFGGKEVYYPIATPRR